MRTILAPVTVPPDFTHDVLTRVMLARLPEVKAPETFVDQTLRRIRSNRWLPVAAIGLVFTLAAVSYSIYSASNPIVVVRGPSPLPHVNLHNLTPAPVHEMPEISQPAKPRKRVRQMRVITGE